jgi:hypothetical protein
MKESAFVCVELLVWHIIVLPMDLNTARPPWISSILFAFADEAHSESGMLPLAELQVPSACQRSLSVDGQSRSQQHELSHPPAVRSQAHVPNPEEGAIVIEGSAVLI